MHDFLFSKKRKKKLKKFIKTHKFWLYAKQKAVLPFWHESKQDRNAWQKNISLCCHVFSARMLHNNWLLGPSRTFVPKENYSDSGKAEERQHLKNLPGFWFCILGMYTNICLLSERSDFTWKASQFYTAGAAEKIDLFLDWRSVLLT